MGRFTLMAAVLAVAAGAGCTPTMLMMLTEKDGGKLQPDCPLPAKDDKKEVVVAILPSADPTVGGDFIGVERELTPMLAKQLAEGSKDIKKPGRPVRVVELPKVEKYLAEHPNWVAGSPGLVGKALGADYTIDMRVNSASMFDPKFGREAYVGQAAVTVAVYDSTDPARPMKEYVHTSHQPAKDTNNPPAQYRQWFMDRLATELSWHHVPHMPVRELGAFK